MINSVQYRDPWLAEGLNESEYIGFYPREFYCFDNFSAFKIKYNGVTYSTVEEAYQAQKFNDPKIREEIIRSGSAHEAKLLAQRYGDNKRADWDEVKLAIMEELLRKKLEQHEYVSKKLLQTKSYRIVEDSPVDAFWGIGPDRKGANHLGEIWMKLRDECIKTG